MGPIFWPFCQKADLAKFGTLVAPREKGFLQSVFCVWTSLPRGLISLLRKMAKKNFACFFYRPGHVFGRFSKSSHGRILISWNSILYTFLCTKTKRFTIVHFFLLMHVLHPCVMSFTTIQYVNVRYLTS